MSKNNVVAIGTHPKFRSVAALREYLEGGDDKWGTHIDLERELNSDDPATRQMLYDLNEWCEGLKNLDTTMQQCEGMLREGLKKGDFYNLGALPSVFLPGPTPLHHMSRNMERNTIRLTNEYKVRETPRDDA